MSVYMTKELEMNVEKLRLYSANRGHFKRDKPAIVYKKSWFNNWFYRLLFYPFYVKECKQFDKDKHAINQIKEAGKELRNRDITLKVIMASDDVKDEADMIGFCSGENYDWDEMFELYVRNMIYKGIYKNKLKLLKNINHVLNCKSLDREKSKRYLNILKKIKQELENDIPQGGRDK